MRDREAVNRFVSFYLLGDGEYPNGDMDGFLVDGIRKLNELTENEREKLRNLFGLSMKLNFELFKEHAFRKSLKSENNVKTLINISLFDVLSVSYANLLEKNWYI